MNYKSTFRKPNCVVASILVWVFSLNLVFPAAIWAEESHEGIGRPINNSPRIEIEKSNIPNEPCQSDLTDDERENLEDEMSQLNAKLLAGQIPKSLLTEKMGEIMAKFKRPNDPDRDGEVASLIHRVMESGLNMYLYGQALKNLSGKSTASDPNPYPDVQKEALDKLVFEATNKIRPHFEKLKSLNINLVTKDGNPAWDFSKANLNLNDLRKDPQAKAALEAVFSPDFANKLLDPDRKEALVTTNGVLLPPGFEKSYKVSFMPNDRYEISTRNGVQRFANNLAQFMKDSDSVAQRNTFMEKAFADSDYKTVSEVKAEGTEKLLRQEIANFKKLGIPNEVLSGFYSKLSQGIGYQNTKIKEVENALDKEIEIYKAIQKELIETAVLGVVTFGVGAGIKAAMGLNWPAGAEGLLN